MTGQRWRAGVLAAMAVLLVACTPQTGDSAAPSGSALPSSAAPSSTPLPTSAPPSTPLPTSAPPVTTTPAPPPPVTQTLGVGGIPAPAPGPGVTLVTSNSTAPLNISKSGIWDCGGHTVGRITVKASGVVVQNCKIVAGGQYGAVLDGARITFRNNDIKGVRPSGDGDMNAITAWGPDMVIAYNTAIDFASNPGGSHTDFIQTWVSSSHPQVSSNWRIVGNKAVGPANPRRDSNVPSIHQWLMQEGPNRGGNHGGSSTKPSNWLIADNEIGDSWNQAIKLDGIVGVKITRNRFVGSSNRVIEVTSASSGVKFYADNQVTGKYGSIGMLITQGAGPATK